MQITPIVDPADANNAAIWNQINRVWELNRLARYCHGTARDIEIYEQTQSAKKQLTQLIHQSGMPVGA